jgi:hypothetical protein
LFINKELSKEESFEVLVGNHSVLLEKSLLVLPKPIIFLACVTKNELFMIDSDKSELRTNQRCCLAFSRVVFILKSKSKG